MMFALDTRCLVLSLKMVGENSEDEDEGAVRFEFARFVRTECIK